MLCPYQSEQQTPVLTVFFPANYQVSVTTANKSKPL